MKKILVSILMVIVAGLALFACAPKFNNNPTVYSKVKEIEISVQSENEFSINTFNVFLTNSNYEPTKTSILASEDVNTGYAMSHKCSSLDEYNYIIESDIGKVHIVFELYLQVKYKTKILPYTIRFSKDYYTKLEDDQIILFVDEKCEKEANFNFDVNNVKYSTGDVYSDFYNINLKIYVEKNEVN